MCAVSAWLVPVPAGGADGVWDHSDGGGGDGGVADRRPEPGGAGAM